MQNLSLYQTDNFVTLKTFIALTVHLSFYTILPFTHYNDRLTLLAEGYNYVPSAIVLFDCT